MLALAPKTNVFGLARWRSISLKTVDLRPFQFALYWYFRTNKRPAGKAGQGEKVMNRHVIKLVALPQTGGSIHIVADFQVKNDGVWVLTACGKLFRPQMLADLPHNQVSCIRCRSMSQRYNHRLGYRAEHLWTDQDVDDSEDSAEIYPNVSDDDQIPF